MQMFKKVVSYLVISPLFFSVGAYAALEPKKDLELEPRTKPVQQDEQAVIKQHEQFVKQKSTKDDEPIEALVIDEIGNVGIGTTKPQARLHVSGQVPFYGDTGEHSGMYLQNNSTQYATATFRNRGDSYALYALNDSSKHPTVVFESKGSTYALNIKGITRGLLVETTHSTASSFHAHGGGHAITAVNNNKQTNYPTIWVEAQGIGYAIGAQSAKGPAIVATTKNGQHAFYAYGGGYGSFTGAHDVLVHGELDNFQQGMLVSVTGKAIARYTDEGDVYISDSLPIVKLADVANDKNVFGAFVNENLDTDHWHQAAENEKIAIVNALGEGRIWVTNINGAIESGDLITSSVVPGYGMKQADDLLRSSTAAKAIETVNWDSVKETISHNGRAYKRYLLAVVYMAG